MVPLSERRHRLHGEEIPEVIEGLRLEALWDAKARAHIKRRPKSPPKKTIEKVIAKYKELITEITEKPPETGNIIMINTIEDLAKTAEILAKPILHVKEDSEHILYVINDNTKYKYKAIE
jgi:hypothetical protein